MGEVKNIDWRKLTKAQRWWLAEILAKEKLPVINKTLKPVKPRRSLYAKYIKRFLDICVAFIALLVTLPINLLILLLTVVIMGRPILFSQPRVGKDGQIFLIRKFRSMTYEKDERGELLHPNERVTSFGKFIRKTSLDELLCFWNVFTGDMSLIGPRPLLPEYTHRYHIRHRSRLEVCPGLECPSGWGKRKIHSWQEQFENDVWYVENINFKTDCLLMFHLISLVFDKKNNETRRLGTRKIFIGYSDAGHAISIDEVPEEYIALALKKSLMLREKLVTIKGIRKFSYMDYYLEGSDI